MAAQEEYYHAQIRHAVHLRNVSSMERKKILRTLTLANRELTKKLNNRLVPGMSLQSKRWHALRKDIVQARSQLWRSIRTGNRADMIELAKAEQEFAQHLLASNVPVQLNFATAGVPQLTALVTSQPFAGGANAARTLGQWWAGVEAADQARIMESLQLGLLQGESVPKMVSRVRAGVDMSVHNATTVVRTAANHATSVSRNAFFKENADVVSIEQWVSTLDGRTTAVCRARDGAYSHIDGVTTEGVPEPRLDPPGATPPAHPQCRSLKVGILNPDGIADKMGERPFVRDTKTRRFRERDFRAEAKAAAGPKKWKRWSPKQRNNAIKRQRRAWARQRVGQVPAGTTYDAWLRKQPVAFQNEVLGKAKADLFRKGLKLDQFVDRKGAELTLKQLRSKYNLATGGGKTNVPKTPPPWDYKKQRVWDKSLSAQEKAAFRRWSGGVDDSNYTAIRKAHATGQGPAWAKEAAKNMDAALDRAPVFYQTGTDLFRGMALSADEFESLTTAARFRNQAFSSASVQEGTARQFAIDSAYGTGKRQVMVRVRGNKTGVDISGVSQVGEEREVLLRKGAEYKVVNTVYHPPAPGPGGVMDAEWWEVIVEEI